MKEIRQEALDGPNSMITNHTRYRHTNQLLKQESVTTLILKSHLNAINIIYSKCTSSYGSAETGLGKTPNQVELRFLNNSNICNICALGESSRKRRKSVMTVIS